MSYELFDAVLTKTVLKQLGVSSKYRLIFDNGSFHIRRKVRLTISSQGLDFHQSKKIVKSKEEVLLPIGCKVLLTKNFLANKPRPKEFSKKVTPVGWDKKLNGSVTYINRGHIIAHELYPDDNWKCDKDRKYFTQTEWSNQTSKPDKHGKLKLSKNLAFYESTVKSFLENNPDGKVFYSVELLYDRDDLIPRGIHIKYKCFKKIICHEKCVCGKKCLHNKKCNNKYCQSFKTVNSCNIFIPNADPRLDINYEKADFKIKENTHV